MHKTEFWKSVFQYLAEMSQILTVHIEYKYKYMCIKYKYVYSKYKYGTLKFTNKWLALYYSQNLTSTSYVHATYCWQVWLIPTVDWTCECAGKSVRSLDNTCHTQALLRWWFTEALYQVYMPLLKHSSCTLENRLTSKSSQSFVQWWGLKWSQPWLKIYSAVWHTERSKCRLKEFLFILPKRQQLLLLSSLSISKYSQVQVYL